MTQSCHPTQDYKTFQVVLPKSFITCCWATGFQGYISLLYLHDSYEFHTGVGRVLKLLGLNSWWSEMVATQLHVHIDPGIDGDGMVVQLPVQNLKEEDARGRCSDASVLVLSKTNNLAN